jgi:hypothetical protein
MVRSGILTGLLLVLLVTTALAQNNRLLVTEEFVGPFTSWKNAITDYSVPTTGTGCAGADATSSIQTALTALGTAGNAVLYFPAGTYKITGRLLMLSKQNVMVIGASPSTTILLWCGGSGAGTGIFYLDGVTTSSIRRLTLQGLSTGFPRALIEQGYGGTSSCSGYTVGYNYFDTGNEYTDLILQGGASYGILGGDAHTCGFSETTIRRVDFINLYYGVYVGSYNSLDIWVWDSYFQDTQSAVFVGAGNVRVYRSLFRNSNIADIQNQNGGGFSARGNTSVASRKFLVSSGSGSSTQWSVHGNVILDPLDNSNVMTFDAGPTLLLDNTIRQSAPVAPIVSKGGDFLAIGNTFSFTGNPYSTLGSRDHALDTISGASLGGLTAPQLPTFLGPVAGRPGIREAATAGAIQTQITAACTTDVNNRPPVHIPQGTYNITTGIVIPANCDVQLIGDGFSTVLVWAGGGAGPLITLTGPVKATLRDLTLNGNGSKTLLATNLNQSGSRITMQGAQTSHATQYGLLVETLPFATLDLSDFLSNYMCSGEPNSPNRCTIAVPVATQVSNATLRVFSGAEGSNALVALTNAVSNGGTLLLRDGWYETSIQYLVQGNSPATLILDNRRVHLTPAQPQKGFQLTNFNGEFVALTSDLSDRLEVSGSGTNAKVLLLGLLAENDCHATDTFYSSTASPPATVNRFQQQRVDRCPSPAENTTSNVAEAGSWDDTWVKDRIAPTRAVVVPAHLAPTGVGITDLRLERVITTLGTVNLHLQGTALATVPTVLRLVR